MEMNEQLSVIKACFPDSQIETETGEHGTRILVHQFLAIEPVPFTKKRIGSSVVISGWQATLDNGEDCEYLYEGPNFWDAIKEMASCLAIWKIGQVKEKFDPCLIPN
jgi:hypothetical protein